MDEVHKRFMNRVTNQIWDSFLEYQVEEKTRRGKVFWGIANTLGRKYDWDYSAHYYVQSFDDCLVALEATYEWLPSAKLQKELSALVDYCLKASEIDLGFSWRNGHFIRSGVALLDRRVVNDVLMWLDEPDLKNVRAPFERGLSHLVHGVKDKNQLPSVIVSMYESVEALAKVITGRPGKDLSANAEFFLSRMNVNNEFRLLMRSYIELANAFRHGHGAGAQKPVLSVAECEAFVYLSGTFVRLSLASRKVANKNAS